jgi:hypothetical protein
VRERREDCPICVKASALLNIHFRFNAEHPVMLTRRHSLFWCRIYSRILYKVF